MIRMRTPFVAVFALTLAIGIGHGEDQPKTKAVVPPPDTKEAIMKRKLAEAQKLLEGLALSDFNKIKSSADELAVLRQKAAWMVRKTREYELHTNDFQRQIEALQKAAKNKNIDAATLAYVDMTLTCVKCHQHVRDEVIAVAPSSRQDGRVNSVRVR